MSEIFQFLSFKAIFQILLNEMHSVSQNYLSKYFQTFQSYISKNIINEISHHTIKKRLFKRLSFEIQYPRSFIIKYEFLSIISFKIDCSEVKSKAIKNKYIKF